MTDPDGAIRTTSFQSTGSLRKDIKCLSRGNLEGAGSKLPPLKAVSEQDKIDFCIEAIPSWTALPSTIQVGTKKFTSGASTSVCKVFLHGQGAEELQPNSCVYRFMGTIEEKDPRTLQYNENFVVAAGKLGIAEKVYATKGMHRCTEFCKGRELFAGEESHFLSAMFEGKIPQMSHDNNPANSILMYDIGKTIGIFHNMPLTWISSVISAEEFAKLTTNPFLMPDFVAYDLVGISEGLRKRAIACVPKTGWFAEPVSMHSDLHPANMLALDGESNNIRIIDWEEICIGHRGADLAYFFLCCAGSSLDSRRAFARGYLSESGQTFDDKSVDAFLIDVERCMGIAVATNAALITMFFPVYRPGAMKLLKNVLKVLETEVAGKTAEEVIERSRFILEEGLVQRLMNEGSGSACCCTLM